MANESHWLKVLSVLSARDIAALYAGYVLMLHDLNEGSGTGKRVPGGWSARIELAHLHRMAIDEALSELLKRDPEKFNHIWAWLEFSQHGAVRQAATRMREHGSAAA